MPVPGVRRHERRRADVEITRGRAAAFAAVRRTLHPRLDGRRWFEDRMLSDRRRYLRWRGLFEFLVAADGRRIVARPLPGLARMPRAFETYLLGQVLSFALIARGLEPLHATAVVVGGGAVGFLGDCGRGKSTLGAARRGVAIRPLSPRRAFVELTRNTFNACVLDASRLARQFDLAARVAAAVPVKTLAYPRGLGRLAEVRAAIEADLTA